jgi:hypothetical protein
LSSICCRMISGQWKCTSIRSTLHRSERSWASGKLDAESWEWSHSRSRSVGESPSPHVEWNRTSRAAHGA